MLSAALLTYQELSDYLRGVTSSLLEDDLPRLISTLQYYQDRLGDLAPIIECLNDEPPRNRALRKPTSWVGLPHREKKNLALDELRRREGTSFAAIAALHTLLSPIRRLPSELLTEIFIRCLPRNQFMLPTDAMSPLHLMQVCAEWWTVCVTSPQLWCSLELFHPARGSLITSSIDEQTITTFKVALLDVWISRSGDLPLSLSIQNSLLSVEGVQRALNICSRRLQHLRVLIPEKVSFMLPDREYPGLKSLEIQSPRGLRPASVNKLSAIMTHTPTLRQFTWNSIISPVSIPPPIMLCWPSLTHLTLHATITVKDCLTILSLATNATHLEFKDIFGFVQTVFYFPDITLPHLLTFSLNSPYDISRIFDVLTLPRLTQLSVTCHSWPHESIMGLFQRSRFPLQYLDFFYAPIPEPALMECLELVQATLTELTVQTEALSTVTDVLLDRLTPTPAGDVLCPHLQELAFYGCVSCTPGALARMARSRLPHATAGRANTMDGEAREVVAGPSLRIPPLRSVEVFASDPELVGLKPLRNLGLKLVAYSDDIVAVDLQ